MLLSRCMPRTTKPACPSEELCLTSDVVSSVPTRACACGRLGGQGENLMLFSAEGKLVCETWGIGWVLGPSGVWEEKGRGWLGVGCYPRFCFAGQLLWAAEGRSVLSVRRRLSVPYPWPSTDECLTCAWPDAYTRVRRQLLNVLPERCVVEVGDTC